MNKLIVVLLSLAVVFSFIASPAFAQTASDSSEMAATAPAQIQYTLPYPGVLPDNPLYFLKALRDRIVSFLINDPVKKAEFNLLTSDKRIYAAEMLADKGKAELAVTTLSKSTNYLSEAVTAASDAKKMGKNTDTVLQNMRTAIKKHEEVFLVIQKAVDKKYAGQLQTENARLLDLEKLVNKLVPNN